MVIQANKNYALCIVVNERDRYFVQTDIPETKNDFPGWSVRALLVSHLLPVVQHVGTRIGIEQYIKE